MTTRHLPHIASLVINRPLLILPEKLAVISEVLAGRLGIDSAKNEITIERQPEASGFVGRHEPLDAANPKGGRKPYRQTDKGVAIIDVLGSLVNRGSWIDALSGLSSYDKISYSLSFAVGDPSIKSILLDIDSPGGEAIGAFETGDAVRAAAREKPTMAVVNGMAASAAYAIASGAQRIITTKSGLSGSIGVVMLHLDYSRQVDQAGVTPTLIYAGARKIDGNPYEKLSDDVKAELRAEIDRFYSLFVTNVAQYRSGLSEDAIRATEARTYIGADAVAAGLADEVGTFESVLADLSGRKAALRLTSSKRSPSMTEQTDTVTRAEMDAAVARARTEATAAANADRETAIAAARTEGANAERTRIRSILELEESKGRGVFAMHVAMNTATGVDDAKALIAASPKTAASAGRDSNLGLTIAVPDKSAETLRAETDKDNHGWNDIVDKINAQHRPKQAACL